MCRNFSRDFILRVIHVKLFVDHVPTTQVQVTSNNFFVGERICENIDTK